MCSWCFSGEQIPPHQVPLHEANWKTFGSYQYKQLIGYKEPATQVQATKRNLLRKCHQYSQVVHLANNTPKFEDCNHVRPSKPRCGTSQLQTGKASTNTYSGPKVYLTNMNVRKKGLYCSYFCAEH